MRKITILIACAVVVVGGSVPAVATEAQAPAKPLHKSHHAKHAKAKANPWAALEPYRSMDFVGDYPGDYAARKALGQCVIDLGYGRWMSCDQGGGGPFN
jgi:hypothetical protein